MPDELKEFQDFVERAQRGSDRAARELFEQFGPHIIRVVRRKLDKKLRPKFDSADFMQSVWAAFFADREKKLTFESPAALLAFLTSLARNKVVDKSRQRLGTLKYNVAREHSLEQTARANEPAARQPTPSQIAIAKERWERYIKGQPERNRQILDLLCQGHTHQEIATKLGLNEKTVRRLVRKLDSEAAHDAT